MAFLFEHARECQQIETKYGLALLMHQEERAEQLANDILDLQVKVKNAEMIDFVRAVSPILYHLYTRLMREQLPQLDHFITNAKNDQYDSWNFLAMQASSESLVKAFLSSSRAKNVTTSSLVEFLGLTLWPQDIKASIRQLRQFEKSVCNPIAHLIKAFDEEELYRTTRFSSELFLEQIIALAQFLSVQYPSSPFYFDQIDAVIKQIV